MGKTLAIGWDVAGWLSKKGNVFSVWEEGAPIKDVGKDGNGIITKKADDFITFLGGDGDFLKWLEIPNRKCYDRVVLAVDAPLSYPIAFKAFINGLPLNLKFNYLHSICNPLFYRDTERHIFTQFEIKPMTASADRIGHAATLAQCITRKIEKHPEIELAIIEVYPALFNKHSKLKETCKKSCFDMLSVHFNKGEYAEGYKYYLNIQGGTKRDCADATICGYLATLYRFDGISGLVGRKEYLARNPEIEPNKYPESEGWIYYPDPS